MRFNQVTTTMSATHDWDKHVDLFVSGLAKWVKEDSSDQINDRYKVGRGTRFNFRTVRRLN